MTENQINTGEENSEHKRRKYTRKKNSSEKEKLESEQDSNNSENIGHLQENQDLEKKDEKPDIDNKNEDILSENVENPEPEIKPEESLEKNEESLTINKTESDQTLENEEPQNKAETTAERNADVNEESQEILEKPEEIKEEIIEETVNTEESTPEINFADSKESNYQISLIDENLLRVKVITDKSVGIDCSVKEKSALTGSAGEKQLNKILIHPTEDKQKQEIEIIVSIGGSFSDVKILDPIGHDEKKIETHQIQKLTPNPLVANLIQNFGEKKKDEYNPQTPEEKLEARIGPKNPWALNRLFVRKNLIRGFIGSLIIYFVSVISFYSIASKKNDNNDVIETQRLIVMQDLPENQNLQQHVEDPNKPPEEEKPKVEEDGTTDNKTVPPIVPKKIKKPPRIIGPEPIKRDTTSITTKTDKEIDSLRNANNLVKKGIDTSKFSFYTIPDSLKKEYSQNDVGLHIPVIPKNWKIIDSRMININQTEFEGVVITDTTKREGTLSLFINLDKDGKEYSKEGFSTEYKMTDTTSTAYVKEPFTQAKYTYYKFYIFTKTDKLYINAQVKEEFFNEYKNNIEALVRSITVSRPAGNK